MQLRRYQESDQEAVVQLHKLALVDADAYVPGPWNDDLISIDDEYLDGNGDFLVVESEGRIVAMGAFRLIDETTAEIKRMRVHPEFQRRGLGQRLLEALEARAAELGYATLILDVLPRQTAAIKLYEANGYAETNRAMFSGEEIVLYKKRLAERVR